MKKRNIAPLRQQPRKQPRATSCGTEYFPFVPYNDFNGNCPSTLICPSTVRGDLTVNIASAKRNALQERINISSRNVRLMVAGKANDLVIDFTVTNNGSTLDLNSNGVYLSLQFEGTPFFLFIFLFLFISISFYHFFVLLFLYYFFNYYFCIYLSFFIF